MVAVTADMPKRKAKASTGVILKMKGSIKARAVGPPRPGRIPTQNPTAMPIIIRVNVEKVKTWKNPETNAWTISNIGLASLRISPFKSSIHYCRIFLSLATKVASDFNRP